jgi:hypothetical protein
LHGLDHAPAARYLSWHCYNHKLNRVLLPGPHCCPLLHTADHSKNQPGSYYHLRKPETTTLAMSFSDWLAAWQAWQHSRLLLQVRGGPACNVVCMLYERKATCVRCSNMLCACYVQTVCFGLCAVKTVGGQQAHF